MGVNEMKVLTRKFGEIEIDEAKTLTVFDGLLGFEEYKRYVLLTDPKTTPFCWLQSIEEPNLSLIVMEPLFFKPDYTLNLDQLMLTLGWEDVDSRDLIVYVVVNLSKEDPEKQITANLLGPILINPKTNEMVQAIISDTDYAHDHIVLAA